MRKSTACFACRSRRRKCESLPGATSCTWCTEHQIPCTRKGLASFTGPNLQSNLQLNRLPSPQGQSGWDSPSNPAYVPSVDVAPPPPKRRALTKKGSTVTLPPQALITELVQLYFDLIHDCFHSLFHPPTFIEDVARGDAPPVIVFAMMALSARFSTNEIFAGRSPRDRSDEYAKQSAQLLNLRDVTLTTVQACVLLGAVSITEGEADAESVYYSVACRIANLLHLGQRPAGNPIEREVNIRVWWTLCMIDVWSSTGVALPRQMSRIDDIPLPMDEAIFRRWNRVNVQGNEFEVDLDSGSSLLAQMIKLNRILMEINDAINITVAGGANTLMEEGTVTLLSQKLDDWHLSLPASIHDTPENLKIWASQGLGRLFVAVYLGYYHFGQLLFYQFLHEDLHSSHPNVHVYSQKCKAHAAALCAIVYAANATPDCSVLYTMVGHILVIASSVQIHTLLFGTDDIEISAARKRLEGNFEALTELRRYWPTLEVCFARLRAFHRTARSSMDTSFQMNGWMLRFLSHFARMVGDKEEKNDDGRGLNLVGLSPNGVSPC